MKTEEVCDLYRISTYIRLTQDLKGERVYPWHSAEPVATYLHLIPTIFSRFDNLPVKVFVGILFTDVISIMCDCSVLGGDHNNALWNQRRGGGGGWGYVQNNAEHGSLGGNVTAAIYCGEERAHTCRLRRKIEQCCGWTRVTELEIHE